MKMSVELVLRNQDRMIKYKMYSLAFSYPDDTFFKFFPDLKKHKNKLQLQYDELFRKRSLWLYTSEYVAKSEFQRTNYLADIMGFYKAFGVNPDKDRPDSIAMELEFMYYLIYKTNHLLKTKIKKAEEKIMTCEDTQKKFFNEHLYEGVSFILKKISQQKIDKNYYSQISTELKEFLETEKKHFN